MLKPVYPVVRLPYDRPNRVARVLDTVRDEFRASHRVHLLRLQTTAGNCPRPMTARESTDTITAAAAADRTGSTRTVTMTTAVAADTASVYVDQNIVDQVTVGVRDCTLTPKARPEILVSAGGNTYLDNKQQQHILAPFADADGGPYLLVPPVNITAEISRPPLTAAAPQLYTRT